MSCIFCCIRRSDTVPLNEDRSSFNSDTVVIEASVTSVGDEGVETSLSDQCLPHRTISILCADDDPMCLSIMRMYLERAFKGKEYRVVFVGDGKNALNAFLGVPFQQLICHVDNKKMDKWTASECSTHHQFDLIFSDNTMPELKGIDFAAACAQSKKSKPPIILISGDQFPKQTTFAGINLILQKPVFFSKFQEAVRTFLPTAT